MTPYSRPGIGVVDQDYMIQVITEAFGLKNTDWVTTRCRKVEYSMPKQVLMACMVEILRYTLHRAGEVCHRDHSTVVYSYRHVHNTLMNDKQYGPIVRQIYAHLKETK